jgi:hypothetical protein
MLNTLAAFAERHGVVFQHLAVNRLHAERHLRLVSMKMI